MMDGNNIVGHDPFRLDFSDGTEIPSAEVTNRSSDVNQFDVDVQGNSIF